MCAGKSHCMQNLLQHCRACERQVTSLQHVAPCSKGPSWDVRRLKTVMQVFRVLGQENVNVKMMSQGASKTNISLIVADAEARNVVQALHNEFF